MFGGPAGVSRPGAKETYPRLLPTVCQWWVSLFEFFCASSAFVRILLWGCHRSYNPEEARFEGDIVYLSGKLLSWQKQMSSSNV